MNPKFLRGAVIVALVLACVAATLWGNLFLFSSAPAYNKEAKTFHIPTGAQLHEVLKKMEDLEVIRDKTLFKYYLVLRGMTTKVRAGDYLFKAGISPRELADELRTGDFRTYRVRIIEGWNLRELAFYLERMGFTDRESFLQACRDPELMKKLGVQGLTMEGYLFPDTYQMYRSVSNAEMVQHFVRQFKKVYSKKMQERADEMGLTTLEVVTIASIIEKETGRNSELELVSSVIFNRLKRGIPLAMDPSVIYGVPNFDGNLTRLHLMTPTPYNTYLFAGLPPGPIANPGAAALQAALNPATSSYLYFVSKGNGYHHFSETLDEHNRAVRKYQLGRSS